MPNEECAAHEFCLDSDTAQQRRHADKVIRGQLQERVRVLEDALTAIMRMLDPDSTDDQNCIRADDPETAMDTAHERAKRALAGTAVAQDETQVLKTHIERLHGLLRGATKEETRANLFTLTNGRMNTRSIHILADELHMPTPAPGAEPSR